MARQRKNYVRNPYVKMIASGAKAHMRARSEFVDHFAPLQVAI